MIIWRSKAASNSVSLIIENVQTDVVVHLHTFASTVNIPTGKRKPTYTCIHAASSVTCYLFVHINFSFSLAWKQKKKTQRKNLNRKIYCICIYVTMAFIKDVIEVQIQYRQIH